MSDKTGGTPSTEGEAVFGFEDLQGLREEYEERIRLLKAEHETQLKKDGESRQELITDLTFELAAAREEGEMRARQSEAKRMSLENELRMALTAIDRIEAEVSSVKLALADALSPTDVTKLPPQPTPAPAPAAAAPPPAPAPAPPAAVASSGPVAVAPSPPVAAAPAPITSPPSTPPAPITSATSEVAVQAADVVAEAAAPLPPPVPVDPTPASTAAGARRKKIRLR